MPAGLLVLVFDRHKRSFTGWRYRTSVNSVVQERGNVHSTSLMWSTASPRQQRSLLGIYGMNYQPHRRGCYILELLSFPGLWRATKHICWNCG